MSRGSEVRDERVEKQTEDPRGARSSAALRRPHAGASVRTKKIRVAIGRRVSARHDARERDHGALARDLVVHHVHRGPTAKDDSREERPHSGTPSGDAIAAATAINAVAIARHRLHPVSCSPSSSSVLARRPRSLQLNASAAGPARDRGATADLRLGALPAPRSPSRADPQIT